MLNRLEKIFLRIESTICVVAFLSMICVVLWSVLCRRVLHIQFLYGEELTRYLTVWAIFFGTAMAVKEKAHVGVEAAVNLLAPQGQRNLRVITEILTCALFIITFVLSVTMMHHYFISGQTTTLTKIPMWIIYLCVPLGMLFSVFHSIRLIFEAIRDRNKPSEEEAKA